MNKYFQFKVYYKPSVRGKVMEIDIVGDIIAQTEDTVTVRFNLPDGEEQVKVFEKSYGVEFNYLKCELD